MIGPHLRIMLRTATEEELHKVTLYLRKLQKEEEEMKLCDEDACYCMGTIECLEEEQ